MIFIQFTPESETKAFVHYQHNMPFDEENGLHKTEAELLAMPNSRLVESIPEPQPPEGQMEAGLYINPQTNEFWYEYIAIPPSPEEQQAQIKFQIALMQQALDELILGGTL